jgi:hypothetical protein
MPMRNALVMPVNREEVQDHDNDTNAWLVVGFCLIGLLGSLCFLLASHNLAEVPSLITQYNLG